MKHIKRGRRLTMKLLENEQELVKRSADTLIFNTFRKGSVMLTLTNQRVIIGKILGNEEYSLEDIVSVERFKAMFMNIGIRFHLKDGRKISLSTRHIKEFVEQLQNLGKI